MEYLLHPVSPNMIRFLRLKGKGCGGLPRAVTGVTLPERKMGSSPTLVGRHYCRGLASI